MNKRNKIIYWVATVWLALGLTSAGIVQLIPIDDEIKLFSHLGFPLYLLPFLGASKLAGVIAILTPKFPRVKEWAYAGIFFTMLGATYAHIAVHDPFGEIAPLLFLLLLVVISWYFRPAERKI